MGKSNPNVIWPHKLALFITFSQDPEFLSGKRSPFTLFLVQLKGKALEKGRIKSVEIVFLFIYLFILLNLLLSCVELSKYFSH